MFKNIFISVGNIYRAIRDFVSKLGEENKDQLYRNGFKFAMEAYYIDGLTLDQIDATVSAFDFNEFDKGITAAIRVISRNAKDDSERGAS